MGGKAYKKKTFWYLLRIGFWKNHREHRGHRENSNSLCPPCPLWLIFFAITHIHPEEIKKPHEKHKIVIWNYVEECINPGRVSRFRMNDGTHPCSK